MTGSVRRVARGICAALPLVVAALALGCASQPPPPANLQFLDSKIFDDQLHDSLGYEHKVVTVSFTGFDATVNRVPARLDRWLYAISKRDDGKVSLVPDPSYPVGKGVIGLAIPLAIGVYKIAQNKLYYAPVNDYNAVVYYIPTQGPTQGTLTRIIFERKPGA